MFKLIHLIRKIFLYFDVFNFIYKHHDQYTSYTHNFSFAKVLDGTPVNLTKLSKVAFSASDRSFYLLNRKWVPTLSYSCFQFFNGEQLNPLFKHSITQLRPYAIVHRVKVRPIRWPKVFLDEPDAFSFKIFLAHVATVTLLRRMNSLSG